MVAIDLNPLGLSDPSYNAVRGAIARAFVRDKSELGVAHFSDADIVAREDAIAWHPW